MKRILALFLSAAMLLTGCSSSVSENSSMSSSQTTTVVVNEEVTEDLTANVLANTDVDVNQFDDFGDPIFLQYVEDNVYAELAYQFNSDDYIIENVTATYISQEYLDEVAFNSQSNIYFGYTISELDEMFEGTRYVFTLGEDGTTAVQELVEIEETDTDTIIKNVAIGTGVILICVTVSVVTAGAGAPAVSMIFAAGAKTAAVMATSSAAFGGISAGVVRGIETGDMGEALDAAALGASEGFKWGAITGAVSGGVSQGCSLYGAAKQTNFTMNQYAKIQQETGYPLDVIKQFHTIDEYSVFKEANLTTNFVNGKTALVRNIDLNFVDDMGRTNLQRMEQGLAALDPATGKAYELHHIGQKADGTLAILTQAEHDNPALHGFLARSEAHAVGNTWDSQRKAFWKAIAQSFGG